MQGLSSGVPNTPIGIIIMTEQFKIKAPPGKIQNNCKIFWEKYIFNTLKICISLIPQKTQYRTNIYCSQVYHNSRSKGKSHEMDILINYKLLYALRFFYI